MLKTSKCVAEFFKLVEVFELLGVVIWIIAFPYSTQNQLITQNYIWFYIITVILSVYHVLDRSVILTNMRFACSRG